MDQGAKRLLGGCVVLLGLGGPAAAWAADPSPGSWRFAVSGDSRNCGDVVMPAIARSVAAQRDVQFYWHLGDFRLLGRSPNSTIDQDMQAEYGGNLTAEEYRRIAWGDFIAHQVAPFGTLQVFLGIGNHELYKSQDSQLTERQNVEASRAEFTKQFSYWLDSPPVRKSRGSQGGAVKAYYHWLHRNVDFINLDNADEGKSFDDNQLRWLSGLLVQDRANQAVRSIVVGMHRALPNSLACGHSMNGDPEKPDRQGTLSGRAAYEMLARWQKDTGRPVYVLASHSHFYMAGIFNTPYWKNRNEVLPGWIVGTAGAQRYALPDPLPAGTVARTKVSGYLLGTVAPDGTIAFELKEVTETDVPVEIKERYGENREQGEQFVHQCFKENYSDKSHPPPATCAEP
jgi:hypothetical protein